MIRIPLPNESRAPALPPPPMLPRSRHETSTRDTVNAAFVEQWQTDAPYGINNRRDPNAQAAFYDMMPQTARTDPRSFLQSQPYVATDDVLAGNPYFQKYDVKSDPRNVARELRGAVFEIPDDRGLRESKKMLERQFTAAHVSENDTKMNVETIISARDRLMPAMDDMSKIYPRTINSWGVCAASRTNQK